MPLPVIETPKYELRLPSSNKRIQYRPYLVKEEKILMVARESNDQKQITQAIKDTISSCLEEVSVNTENLPDAKIQLTDKIGVVMNWPNVNLISELAEQDKSDTGKVVMSVIVGCIDSIFDEKVVHRASDHTPEELHQFIESLNQTQFNKIRKFIESTPKLEHKIEYKCSHCGADNSLTLTGLQNFFS